MESSYKYLFDLGLILLFAHIGGRISKRFKQPAVLGQIIAGIILGSGILVLTEFIESFAQIGVILLMLIAGLETDVKELKRSGKASAAIAIGGIVVPAGLVFTGIYALTGEFEVALFLGVVAMATSVSISVQTLREIGQLRTRQGITILGSAIIDDVVGIIALTLLVGIISPSQESSVFRVVAMIVGFFIVMYVIAFVFLKIYRKQEEEDGNLEEKIVYFALIGCFLISFMAEEFGIAAITGSYFVGVIFSMTHHKHKISHEVNKVSKYMFTPVFFVSIGMGVNLAEAYEFLAVGLALFVLASLGKIVGCGFAAKMSGFSKKEAIQIGIGMVPRAEVALIIANLGAQMGVLSEEELGATILLVLCTTLVTPSLLKWSFREDIRNSALEN